MLKLCGLNQGSEVRAQEFDAVALIRLATQTHPNEMNVIRHQAISGTNECLSRGSVKNHFPKSGMEFFVEPSLMSQVNRHRPKYNCVRLIKLAFEPRKVV